MNKVIYKYILDTVDEQVINLPVDSEILTVQVQKENVYLWALINPNESEEEERYIEIFGTGNPVGYDMGVDRKYIATYQLLEGSFIGHVFERLN